MRAVGVLDQFRLDGHVAVVTGGGRGIGRGIALAFAEAGADVAVAARRAHEVEAVADEVRQLGRRAFAMGMDVLDFPANDRLAEATVAELGKLTIWVNNAGGNLDRTQRTLVDTPEDVWDTLVDLNLKSAWWGAKAAVEQMADGGNIINIASVAAWGPSPTAGPYAATKSAMINMTKTLAMELAPQKIRVNCIAPGLVPTEMFFETMKVDEAAVEEMGGQLPAGRAGKPEDLGAAAVYFCSPAAEWITGQTLAVSGGPTGTREM